MKVLKYPIITLLFFFVPGILAGYCFAPPLALLCIVTAAGFAALSVTWWQAKKALVQTRHFAVAAFVLAFLTGMLTQAFHYAPNSKLHYSHFLEDTATPLLKGVISERLKPTDFQQRYYFDVLSVNRHTANGKILLAVPRDNAHPLLHAGDAILIADTPQPIARPLNPGQFDYAAYMEKQGVFHQLHLGKNYMPAGTVKNFDYYIGRFREKLLNSFKIHNYSPQVQNTLDALLLGQRQDMDAQTANDYKNAGVLHILAISGLHFAVLFYLLNLLFKPLARFSRKGRLLQFIAVLVLLWGFAFVTGLSASVVRSVVMFTFVSLGIYFNRNANIYNSLAISMLVLLLAKPDFLFDAGFQLSYLAVFSIVALEPFYRNVKLSKFVAVNYFIDTLLISLAAQIGVLPLSLYYFHQLPLLFLVANLVVIPLSNIVLVFGLFVLLLNFIWQDAAIAVGKALALLVEVMNGFISRIASLDSLVLKDIPFTMLLNLSLYGVIISGLVWLYKKSYRRTAALLCSAIIFQGIYILTASGSRNGEELIVFNNYKESLLAIKSGKTITVISNDSLALGSPAIASYTKSGFGHAVQLHPLQNVLMFGSQKILVLDNRAAYTPEMKPDILILTHSPKVNLERIIGQLEPKQIIADGTNYKNLIKNWAATCQKEKIPFHATAEKGFYQLNK
jgi:competence protein ComEC